MDPISYEPVTRARRPSRRRWRLLRWSLAAAIVVACVLVASRCGGPVVRQVRYLAAQRGCLTYEFPANRVVYEDGPAGELSVAGGTPEYLVFPGRDKERLTSQVIFSPAARNALPEMGASSEFRYQRYVESELVDGLAFLHERRTPSGSPRLVVVRVELTHPGMAGSGHLARCVYIGSAEVFQPGGYAIGSRATLRRYVRGVLEPFNGVRSRLRIYAGVPDAGDASRFAIPYDVKPDGSDWLHGALEGRLTDDDEIHWRHLGPRTPKPIWWSQGTELEEVRP